MIIRTFFLLSTLFLSFPPISYGEIYKYQDENGEWIFSDREPGSTIQPEILQFEPEKQKIEPKIYTEKIDGNNTLVVANPYYAPIQIRVYSDVFRNSVYEEVIPAATTKILYESKNEISSFRYRWVMGAPNPEVVAYPYQFPVASKKSFEISQAFGGAFSHKNEPNVYAVDIAMEVGTYIGAARAGNIIWVKDDYHMGGAKEYFLDKANYVGVLHDDGTYAVYAHILLGSALVKPGDKVEAGDKLAMSGSSGFSTGPHLHFVIRKNDGFKTSSVRFLFSSGDNKAFEPRKGMRVVGNL